MAVGTHGADHIEIKGRLLRPSGVVSRIVALLPALIDLSEATICGTARRQTKLRSIDGKIGLGVPVTIGINDRDCRGRVSRASDYIGAPKCWRSIA